MIQVGRKYTSDELAHLRATTSESELKGLVLSYNIDGTAQFVPWHQATGGGIRENGRETRPLREYAVTNPDFGEIEPIRKRTPLQRVDSLMLKVLGDMKAGRVLTEAQIKEIVGEAWKDGRTEITGEVVRQVAQRFLERAEKENAASN